MNSTPEPAMASSVDDKLNRYCDALFYEELSSEVADEELQSCRETLASGSSAVYVALAEYRIQMLAMAVIRDAECIVRGSAQDYYEAVAAHISAGSNAKYNLSMAECLEIADMLIREAETHHEDSQKYRNRAYHAEQFMKSL